MPNVHRIKKRLFTSRARAHTANVTDKSTGGQGGSNGGATGNGSNNNGGTDADGGGATAVKRSTVHIIRLASLRRNDMRQSDGPTKPPMIVSPATPSTVAVAAQAAATVVAHRGKRGDEGGVIYMCGGAFCAPTFWVIYGLSLHLAREDAYQCLYARGRWQE